MPSEHLNIMPRAGDKPLRRVTEMQARSLMAYALVDPICQSRRGSIVGLRIRNGITLAAINTALRVGAGNRLPRAEDNQTVRRVNVPGGGIYFEQCHVRAWSDGRQA
jgi:hypothetical protein